MCMQVETYLLLVEQVVMVVQQARAVLLELV
jgi:hypothetical protein